MKAKQRDRKKTEENWAAWGQKAYDQIEAEGLLPLIEGDIEAYNQRLIDAHSLVRRLYVKQSCHSLRKTGATIFYLASSYDITATQQFLGHASPETTRRYIGISSQKVKEYSITSSEWLKNAIEFGEFDLLHQIYNNVALPFYTLPLSYT